jgi:hypothetical protein
MRRSPDAGAEGCQATPTARPTCLPILDKYRHSLGAAALDGADREAFSACGVIDRRAGRVSLRPTPAD